MCIFHAVHFNVVVPKLQFKMIYLSSKCFIFIVCQQNIHFLIVSPLLVISFDIMHP